MGISDASHPSASIRPHRIQRIATSPVFLSGRLEMDRRKRRLGPQAATEYVGTRTPPPGWPEFLQASSAGGHAPRCQCPAARWLCSAPRTDYLPTLRSPPRPACRPAPRNKPDICQRLGAISCADKKPITSHTSLPAFTAIRFWPESTACSSADDSPPKWRSTSRMCA